MSDFGSRWRLSRKEPLGAGGQGSASVVEDVSDASGRRHVAKVLKGANLTEQSPRWQRLEEEIRLGAGFNHPNVIPVIDSGHTHGSGYPFFVMPHYARGSLQENRPLASAPREIFRLFAELCVRSSGFWTLFSV